MFKQINENTLVNVNAVIKIEDIGIDIKDGKNYCRIFLINGDPSGIVIEGTLQETKNYLTK